MKQGLTHIYCGEGKGKTTAALGLAIRSAGRGFNVLFIQFLKSQDTGELYSLEKIPEIEVLRSEEEFGFTFNMTEDQKARCRRVQDEMLQEGIARCQAGQVDLLILDEILAADQTGLLDHDALLTFLKTKSPALEVVLTGREPAEELTELADYVSEIKKIKHPFDQGIGARRGIEQ